MYINREISWLEFNQRVLSQAKRTDLPLLERLKFLSITASNLDEFFQVRVGGLMILRQSGKTSVDLSGLTATDQLQRIRQRATEMVDEQYRLMRKEIMPLLEDAGLSPTPISSLTETQQSLMEEFFHAQIAPLLTPLAMEVKRVPTLPSLTLIIGVELFNEEEDTSRFVAIPIPDSLPRRVHFSGLAQESYVLLEDLIGHFIGQFFTGERVYYQSPFRVTRNGDIAVVEEEGSDLAHEMEEVLVARKFSDCVRLEIPTTTPKAFARRIADIVKASDDCIYRVRGPLRLVDFGSMAFEPGNDLLKIKDWRAAFPAGVDADMSMFDNIAQGDILINNPFESYEPVVRLVEQAAADPKVVAIKQVLYRTAKKSRFIDALCRAAELGKQVTVLVELKARFDEQRNLAVAEKLQRRGVQVIYGVKGFKTHAKVLLIVRRENNSLRRYCHFGTGNYNESTSRIYGDISLLTCNEKLGADAAQFFNSVTGLTRLMSFRRIFPSPAMMKARLIELIDAEAERAKRGEKAAITAKMNSLNDVEMMAALERAATAGVKLRLNIRGVCCWAPTSPQAMANTRIVSIIDRYLEHARILAFHNGGKELVYLASADWMSRNLDRRVELMVPIESPALAKRAMDILEACFKDNTQAFLLMPDGTSIPVSQTKADGSPARPFRMQEHLQRQATSRARASERARRQVLEPQEAAALSPIPKKRRAKG